jgi:hypothetical protein
MDQPEVHNAIGDMRRVERLLIRRAYLRTDRLRVYYGVNLTDFHCPSIFT